MSSQRTFIHVCLSSVCRFQYLTDLHTKNVQFTMAERLHYGTSTCEPAPSFLMVEGFNVNRSGICKGSGIQGCRGRAGLGFGYRKIMGCGIVRLASRADEVNGSGLLWRRV